jgi:O-antigen ligase
VIKDLRSARVLIPRGVFWGLLLVTSAIVIGVAASLLPWISLGLAVASVASLSALVVALLRPEVPLLLLVLSVPFQFEYEVGLMTLTPFDLLVSLAFISALMRIGVEKDTYLTKVPYLVPYSVYLLSGALAIALDPDITEPLQGVWRVYKVAVVIPLVYYLVSTHLRTRRLIARAFSFLLIGTTLACLTGIVQTLFGGMYLSGLRSNYRYLGFLQPMSQETRSVYQAMTPYQQLRNLYLPGTDLFRAHGTFYSSNFFAAFLNVTLPLTLCWFIFARSRRHRLLLGISAFAQFICLLATFSRTGWVSLLISLLFIVLFLVRKGLLLRAVWRSTAFAVAVAIFALGGLVAAWTYLGPQLGLLYERFSTVLEPQKSVEFTGRFVLWELSLSRIATHPLLGLGAHTVKGSGPLWGVAYDLSSHQILLDIAYTKGLIALAALLVLLLAAFRDAVQVYVKERRSLPVRGLALGALAGLVGLVVHGINESVLAQTNLEALFWLLLGIAVALKRDLGASSGQNSI